MLYESLIVLIIFGLIQYYDNILHILLILFVLYIIYIYFTRNKSDIYEQLDKLIKTDKTNEFIDSNSDIKNISEYKKYNQKSFLKGIKYYKKINKYLDKLDTDKTDKYNKNILENCIYYLDESTYNFNQLANNINDIEIINNLKDYINKYKDNNKNIIKYKIREFKLENEYYFTL